MPKNTVTIGDDETIRLTNLVLEQDGQPDVPLTDDDATVSLEFIDVESEEAVIEIPMPWDSAADAYVGTAPREDTAELVYRRRYRVVAIIEHSSGMRSTIDIEVTAKRGGSLP